MYAACVAYMKLLFPSKDHHRPYDGVYNDRYHCTSKYDQGYEKTCSTDLHHQRSSPILDLNMMNTTLDSIALHYRSNRDIDVLSAPLVESEDISGPCDANWRLTRSWPAELIRSILKLADPP